MAKKGFKDLQKGDRVVYLISSNHGEWAIVEETDCCDNSLPLLGMMGIKIRLQNGDTKIVYEHDIYIPREGAVYLNLKMIQCDCGLKYVRDGGLHSSWCKIAYQNQNQ